MNVALIWCHWASERPLLERGLPWTIAVHLNDHCGTGSTTGRSTILHTLARLTQVKYILTRDSLKRKRYSTYQEFVVLWLLIGRIR